MTDFKVTIRGADEDTWDEVCGHPPVHRGAVWAARDAGVVGVDCTIARRRRDTSIKTGDGGRISVRVFPFFILSLDVLYHRHDWGVGNDGAWQYG